MKKEEEKTNYIIFSLYWYVPHITTKIQFLEGFFNRFFTLSQLFLLDDNFIIDLQIHADEQQICNMTKCD